MITFSTALLADEVPAEVAPAPTQAPAPTAAPAPAPADDPNALPSFMQNKARMAPEDLANKVEGRYFTGLPLANSDPDTGIGFGARLYVYDNGSKTDRLFEYTPYRQRAYAQAFFTTNGYQFHTIDYDAPYIFRQPLRLRSALVFERNTAANYFGVGPASLGRLRFPAAPGSFASLSDYDDAIQKKQPDGTAFSRYNQYILERPEATATLERDFFGGIVRVLAGYTVSYVDVRQWSGRIVDSSAGDARSAPTRLDADCAAGRVVGCGGGFDDSIKLGVAYDTRDFEPDPRSGVFVDATSEISAPVLGSAYEWARLTISPRAYVSPFRKWVDLVFAGRLVGSVSTKDTPFFQLDQLSFTDTNRAGLGGLRTIRGYNQDRFVGRTVFLANLEARWTFVRFHLFKEHKQHFALMLVPFFDVGRVFDTIDDFAFARFRNGQGAGFRVAWNQATIIVVDYGVSRETSTLYINFNHPF